MTYVTNQHCLFFFQHELSGAEKAVPPGCKISFLLTRTPSNFYLMRCPSDLTPDVKDTQDYEAVLANCCLFVKVGQMTDPIYKSLQARFEREPIIYHYRKVICKPMGISPQNQTFLSGNLFPDS